MESPFAQYLHTNYAPSDCEVKSIESHLVTHVQELSRLDALIRDLSDQREKTLAYIAAHKVLLSPARRLPRDVVQEIFLACLPTDRNAVLSAREAPLMLGRICSAWRTLALSTPALWASLHIPLQFIFDVSYPLAITTWLERSGQCPLSLSIFGARDMEQWERDYTEQVNEAMEALAASSYRWRSLDLSFLEQGMLRLAQVKTPMLMALKMVAPQEQMEQMKLVTTPSLCSVELEFWRDFDRWILRMPVEWGHLTSLKLDSKKMGGHPAYPSQGMSPSVALEVLKRCLRLIRFETDLIDRPDDLSPASAQPTVLLPVLRELIICRCNSVVEPGSIDYLLQHLSMPELRHLQLPRMMVPNQSVSPFFGDLAARSPLIEELNVHLTGLTHSSLTDNLAALPCLRKLVVLDVAWHWPPAAATASQLLTFLTSATPFCCPVLQVLQLEKCYDWIKDTDLLGFAQSRLDNGGGHFKHLEVGYTSFMGSIAPELLAPFATRGLTISTVNPPSEYRSVHLSPPTPWMGLDDGPQ
ncbi:hypothetical protein MVEN_01762300 [Mycena venus]|uniref:F-box domain-containing protein n=1 Tax=Mycena venus TaxID=2733690 RepID=A0A8H7CML1_9AGAR|nr:hypothetical protein MVEN_01762300 [Mycena venus]